MQRRTFVHRTLAALPALALLPRIATAHERAATASHAFVVRAGESRFNVPTPFRGEIPNDLKISRKDTGNTVSFFDYNGITRVPGPNLHMHLEQDELFYAVDGEFAFQVGDKTTRVKAGDTIYGPRNVPHTWTQLTPTGRLLYWTVPAGTLEDFFAQLATLTQPPTADQALAMHKQHGMEAMGGPLPVDGNYEHAAALPAGFFVKANEARFGDHVINKSPNPIHVKLSARDTGGAFTVLESTINGKGGPPLHVHHYQDEVFYIVEGTYRFQAGDQRFDLGKGDTIFLPRKVPHTWAQTSDKGKMVFMFQPSGKMEEFFAALSQYATHPSPEEGAALFARHEMTVVGPPIAL